METLASALTTAFPNFRYVALGASTHDTSDTPQEALLAQAEAVVHKPLSFASSPSLPGTISSP